MKKLLATLLALLIGFTAPAIGFAADGDKKDGTKQEAEPDCD